ncbi:hypothetical protein AWB80_01348 [Caballeronia pedi]|uniref:Uncharacterized protein n=1 Tax=Caballeronia pedi TaxID=1777141 RepID=A0A157ZVB4_9BURK|nr:hypothetical protein [Caballeronia pedi]SAK49441.1 hypothetical protein AWB80_01348 [Caballeronia pedi]
MSHLRPSKWTYHADIKYGMNADIVIASGGEITLIDPNGKRQSLYFGRSRIDAPAHGGVGRVALPLMVLPQDLRGTPVEVKKPSPDAAARKAESLLPGAKKLVDGLTDSLSTAIDGTVASVIGQAAPQPATAKEADTANAKAGLPERNEAAGEKVKQAVPSADDDSKVEKPAADANEKGKAKADEAKDEITEAPTAPTVFMTDAFFGQELSLTDFRGGAVFVDARMRLFPDADACALLLGINVSEMMMGFSSAETFWMTERAIAQARVVLLMSSTTVGLHIDPHIGVLPGYLN